ncbi:uncharacterized protein PFLUO_LOCUS3033 [Penicillium psychrofluorescens]|uniref:uncharacterized protein n=1 Tax=Penicillium psychrofluorescens TaxID=3158075 RepID=UPI003CCD5EFF
MSNPLSPLSSSHRNARAHSPHLTSSPFLTKPMSAGPFPSSPLKNSLKLNMESHEEYPVDENDSYVHNDQEDDDDDANDNDSFHEAPSSPFQPETREDTVDFGTLREIQRMSPGLGERDADDTTSSPFQPDTREETVDFQRLHQLQQPMSSGLDKRFSFDDPTSSPFRTDGRDDTVDLEKLRELQGGSPGLDAQPLIDAGASSPFRPEENAINSQKLRHMSRSPYRGNSATARPRKRSFDETPQDHGDEAQMNERCKKGMMSRVGDPGIHVDEDPSLIYNESMVSAAHNRSTVANSVMEDKHNEGMSTVLREDGDSGIANKENFIPAGDDDMHDSMDDTCLSTFSAVPNVDMTEFASLRGASPLKAMRNSVAPSPAPTDRRDPATPGTARRAYRSSVMVDGGSTVGSPTPRRRQFQQTENPGETPNLLDLTDHMNFLSRNSMQSGRYSSSRRSPLRALRESIRSPSKASLLDFDIPPAPTPRSIPTITPRELESLKSGFMSEISSLRATLSGKDAEVASLKKAIADAERRVGEALEEVRNEAARREALEIEQGEWDRRGKEMESVLRSVRAELVEGERERDRLTRKAEEAEKSKEELEGKLVELESQLSAARTSSSTMSGSAAPASKSAEDTAREVQDAVEKVARELHTLYKGKHETKVAALKKSYEGRWEKRVREAENKLATAREEAGRLRSERDAASSESMVATNASMIARENDEHETEKRVLEAQIKGLQQEMAALKEDSAHLRSELKSERAEKGELVAAVDEWLAIQQSQPANPVHEASVSSPAPAEDNNDEPAEKDCDTLRRSVGRSGSIRLPSNGEKRIPRYGTSGGHSRTNSGGKSGIAVFTPGRGGIMGSIERMGRGGM